jgi:hypothetical protein
MEIRQRGGWRRFKSNSDMGQRTHITSGNRRRNFVNLVSESASGILSVAKGVRISIDNMISQLFRSLQNLVYVYSICKKLGRQIVGFCWSKAATLIEWKDSMLAGFDY